ncbi:MAG: TIGR03767 family metallophosphoesterase [Jatrophihabitantaceae bacterium]
MTTTNQAGVVGGRRSERGYWRLLPGPAEPHLTRSELLSGGLVTGAGQLSPGTPLLSVGHLSDLHLCDSQSPVRAEFLDRWSDDDAPTKAEIGYLGTYRPQDCLTVQVGEAAVQALNAVPAGPVGGGELDWAITTGDVTDNAQSNELNWYLGLLDGGLIRPDSGTTDRYEGVADNSYWDEAFWHPEPMPDGRQDRPHRLHGFPDVPGLLDALRAPFTAAGLRMPWLAVHGNHDQMIQGTIPAIGPMATADSDSHKVIGLPPDWSTDAVVKFCRDFDDCQLDALAIWHELQSRPVTPDPARRAITRAEFIAAHLHATARPAGHGFEVDAADPSRAYYRHDHGQVSVLTLDTVNEHGGWQGSLDEPQFEWLADQLAEADRQRRYVVLASHHPLFCLINPRRPGGASASRRVAHAELAELLARHPSLVLWLNGHIHRATVIAHQSWWEVSAPSLIDFPQQGRIVELLRSPAGVLTIACTMLDHAGELPWAGGIASVRQLAGLSRELSVNDWQRRCDDLAKQPWLGTPTERNVLLELPDPYR